MENPLSRYGNTLLILLCVMPAVCLANPVAMDLGGDIMSGLKVVFFDAVVDFFVLLVSFALVRELACLGQRKFIGYFILVVIGGLIIDGIGNTIIDSHFADESLVNTSIGFCIFGVGLIFYNVLLCILFFKINPKNVLFISLAMGILTNPVLWKPVDDALFPTPKNPYEFTTLGDYGDFP
jgi:hypothetical protein